MTKTVFYGYVQCELIPKQVKSRSNKDENFQRFAVRGELLERERKTKRGKTHDTKSMTQKKVSEKSMTQKVWHKKFDTKSLTQKVWHKKRFTKSMTQKEWHKKHDT